MSFAVLQSDFKGYGGHIDDDDAKIHSYGLRFEVVLKEANETIPGKSILAHIIKNIKNNKKYTELLDIHDIFNNIVHPELSGIHPEDFPKRFCFQTAGPEEKLFGLKIRSTISYNTLKPRLCDER
jgi:hypothetical protein